MADDSLKDSVIFDQSILNRTYTLIFNHTEWHLLWRLLRVGCALCDVARPYDSHHANLWTQLSNQFATLIKDREIVS